MRAGTLAAAQLQVQQLTEALKVRDAAPFDAVAAGLLQPKVATVKKRERDKTRIDESEGGDSHLRGLATKARAKQAAKETHATEVAGRREEREKKKAELAAEREAQVEAYTKCHPKCKKSAAASRARWPTCSTARSAATSRRVPAARRHAWATCPCSSPCASLCWRFQSPPCEKAEIGRGASPPAFKELLCVLVL